MFLNLVAGKRGLALLIVLNFLFAACCLAQDGPAAVASVSKPLPPIDFSGSVLSMFKGLAICIAMLMLVVWMLKKFKSPIITGQGRRLKIIEKLPVTARSSLLLVEVNSKQVLIGVGPDPVNLVSDFVEGDALSSSLNSVKEPSGENNEG